ncbi:MAG: 3-deoxy-D-manno-octulosonic acid transferase [Candidatus Hydrogenedentes bacterium]|nr:3-deoxy-D-manno-octulosonic acid transferase [Candidatus Hydrogenedentota bacterium]
MFFLYNSAMTVAAPVGRFWLWTHREHRELLQRFAPRVPAFADRPIWVHACSVGELNTAEPFVQGLKRHFPHHPVLVTTSTSSGHSLAEKKFPEGSIAWCPFDTRRSVRRFLRQARPAALVLIETEIWPNLIREAAVLGIPVLTVNGRISAKHFERYKRYQRFIGPAFSLLTACGMQDDINAKRIGLLGVPQGRIEITGNIKFDAVATECEASVRARVRRENGFAPQQPVLIFGSMRPGDEALAAACWSALKDEVPELRLVLAPRHLDRVDEVAAAFTEPVFRRSQVLKGTKPLKERVFLLDTLGELRQFYSIATAAVIGGSFAPGVGGHNPLEPAALGVPTFFGPHMENFQDVARVLAEGAGVIQTPAEQLAVKLAEIFQDATHRRTMGTRARKIVMSNQGAVQRNLALLARCLAESRGAAAPVA